jgi:hypothetical protein
MSLFGIDFTQQTAPRGFTLAGAARSADGNASTAEAAAPESGTASSTPETSRSKGVSLSSENMMASHFVHAGRKQSEYVSGMMIGLDLQNQFATQMQSVVSGYRDVANLTAMAKALQGKEINNADLSLIGTKAAETMEDVIDGKVSEENAEQAEDIRRDVEERAEEATASESEKVLENETSPQEGLEQSLEDAESVGEDGETAAPAEAEDGGIKAAPEGDGSESAEPGAGAEESAPPLRSLDILV